MSIIYLLEFGSRWRAYKSQSVHDANQEGAPMAVEVGHALARIQGDDNRPPHVGEIRPRFAAPVRGREPG